MKLDAFENLMIRACKDRGDLKTFCRIISKFYALEVDNVPITFVVEKLFYIQKKYSTGNVHDNLFQDAHPQKIWQYITFEDKPHADTYSWNLFLVLRSNIRHFPVADLPGYVSPLRYRNKFDKN